MTANQIFNQAKRYQRMPEADRWRQYSYFKRLLESIVPPSGMDAATRKLANTMNL